MKRAIVTGASGFVGANLARRLVTDGHEVHLIVRPGRPQWRIDEIRGAAHVHEVPLEDTEALPAVVGAIRPEWIFHLAAYGAYASQADLRQMVATNILGTINLVEACLQTGFEAFVNSGSSSEYGFKDHAPTEREWLEPNSHYAVTKASATLFCRHTAQRHGAHLVTLRLYSTYGPYEEPTRFVPTLIVRGLAGELPPLVHPDSAHDYVHVDDVIDAYLLAATQPGQELGAVYNVGSGVQTTVRDVVEIARRAMHLRVEPAWGSMPGRQWDTPHWVCDNHEIRARLNWQPRFGFEEGFGRTLAWFRAHPRWLAYYRDRCADRAAEGQAP